jgi:hypothetical protein
MAADNDHNANLPPGAGDTEKMGEAARVLRLSNGTLLTMIRK